MRPTLLLAVLSVFDFLGVLLGYEGIARLRQFHWPPFLEGLYTIIMAFWPPPNWLILAWDSSCGRTIMWSGSLVFPAAAFILSIGRERHFVVAALMLAWTAASGIIGFWIWFDAVLNATNLSLDVRRAEQFVGANGSLGAARRSTRAFSRLLILTAANTRRVKNLLLPLALLFLAVGCAKEPRGFPPTEGISNFDRVNDTLYRSGQPNHVGLQSLNRVGIKTIVNLRMTNDLWVAEEAEARANGMVCTNVPMRGLGRPTDQQVAQALAIIETFPGPVLIHCEHGRDRTGTIIACYRIQHDHWTSKQALREASQYGMSMWEFGMKKYVADFEKSFNSK